MSFIASEKSTDLINEVSLTEEHIMEAMRAFFTRIDGYKTEFHKVNDFELSSCIIDNIFTEIEIVQQHRDLYFIAKNAVRALDIANEKV